MSVNVRIAPSPTGLLHIGNIRAALFNYLFARRMGGTFMLRLDDTDATRSTQEFADAIKRDLGWLGLNWDKFGRQSDRLARYAEVLEQLKLSGRAYPCFETQAELDLKRKTQLGRGLPPVYDRAALKLSEADIAALAAQGRKPHWRFKLDHTEVAWDDMVQGHKSFAASSLSDPVLVREDGVPLYTFCSVVDDVDDSTTHVIRGEDHVTNTVVQIQIWQAITSTPAPVFAHFPLIVSSSGIEMSKRLGTLSIASMRDEMEIEPMAINALLAKLGTSDAIAPRLTLDELAQEFDIGKISHATPKFDLDELKSLNAKILHITPFEAVRERLAALGLSSIDEKFWNFARANITKLSDIRQWWQVAQGPVTPIVTDAAFLSEAAASLPPTPWNDNSWGAWTDALKAKTGRKGKELFMPLRLALTTYDHGPEMKYLLPLIGEKRARDLLAGRAA
ncbi:MAG: glutamate--tRNA ligase [Alphaproteobacteria bacterium]|nr:glutamate--tRNA ligase [Alphaproteobacteria bacterium]